MSHDYTNREDWLAYRNNKIVRGPKYIHVSGYGLKTRRAIVGGFEMSAGKTYDVGRNKTKRRVRAQMLHRSK